jgi:maltooligosyltrehalose trehalohydrolase
MPIGAEVSPTGGVDFRVWAPAKTSVSVVLFGDGATDVRSVTALERDGEYFSGVVSDARVGSKYKFRLDDRDEFPDPASRFQPDGPHGPSEVVDPLDVVWTDASWHGPTRVAPVLYELHIGTFTTEGTWRAATEKLPELAELGVTMVEVMPVAEFAGRYGWGYDGVDLFAPFHEYGRPSEFREFINRAHELGLAVILDVVYNHFGPDGSYVTQFSESYCTDRYHTDWGPAINFDGDGAGGTREFFLSNARYWIDEFHLDGLRLDATQNMYDRSSTHILAEITAVVRETAAPRDSFVVAENEPQDVRLLRPASDDGFGMDAAWNDDWHHSAMVAVGGRDEAYYADYAGTAREFIAAAKYGYLYQGQWYTWQAQRRGVPGLDIEPRQFVHFLENHDQIANSFRGDRLGSLAGPGRIRAMTALLFLGPQTPMLFQGQEFGSTAPFLFFADHGPELMKLVHDGRTKFLNQFQSIASRPPTLATIDPGDPATFWRCKLDRGERTRHGNILALHRDLIALRRSEPALRSSARRIDGAVLNDYAMTLRFFADDGDDRLLLLNIGSPLHMRIVSEPLLAPPRDGQWTTQWSSEDRQYGGLGLPSLDPSVNDWTLPGNCAVLFRPQPMEHG